MITSKGCFSSLTCTYTSATSPSPSPNSDGVDCGISLSQKAENFIYIENFTLGSHHSPSLARVLIGPSLLRLPRLEWRKKFMRQRHGEETLRGLKFEEEEIPNATFPSSLFFRGRGVGEHMFKNPFKFAGKGRGGGVIDMSRYTSDCMSTYSTLPPSRKPNTLTPNCVLNRCFVLMSCGWLVFRE